MDSNDDIDSNSEMDSNSVSTDAKIEKNSSKVRNNRGSTNVVFVSPNELEDWDIEDDKSKSKKTPRQRSSRNSVKPKQVKPTPKPKKKRGRPKRKKEQNPWGSDVDDENQGLENEMSDDEYFRRLEEASVTDCIDSVQKDTISSINNEVDEEYEEEEEEIFIGQIKTFDLNNSDLLNYIIAERDKTLDIDDPTKPKIDFPPSSIDFNCPQDSVLQLFGIYETVIQYHKILRISPFKIEDFIAAMVSNENSNLLSELHMTLLKLLLREDEAANTSLCPLDQKDSVNISFYFMDSMTWPELLRLYIKSIDTKSSRIEISEAYPFVSLHNRIDVIIFLLDLFINGSSLRFEVSRENVITHEDFCRVCHLSGEVLCCDSCSAVYHLDCLTPQLTSVPKTTWNCPICVKHKIPGLFDCNFDGDKALVEHKKTPLGTDRFGNTYWLLARRLIIEPRNDNIQFLADSINGDCDQKDFEPDYDQVLYYSCWGSVEKIREQLSRDWEAELCDVFDSVAVEMKKSMEITDILTKEGMEKFKTLSKLTPEQNVVCALESEKTDENNENSVHPTCTFENSAQEAEEEINNCTLKTHSGQQVGVIEDQEGLLMRNIDGNTIRVRLSAKTRGNQLEEVASVFNCDVRKRQEENTFIYHLGDEGNWRFYVNLFSTEFQALSKNQHQEEKDKKRILGNKFSLNESNEFQWFLSQSCNRASWPSERLATNKPIDDVTGGPLSMLQCLRLTLQNMEAQMFSSFMCPAWKSERKNWLINIQRTRNASSLADFVAIFESAIRPCALKKVWSNSLGYLYLDRVTAAEREEEKRVKTVERKSMKPDGDVVKTRNPGLLNHTIWKTKGEEFRRLSGDGWTWLSASIAHNKHRINHATLIKEEGQLIIEEPFVLGSSDEEVVNICKDVDDENVFPRKSNVLTHYQIDDIFKLRTIELEKATSDFDLEASQTKLADLTNSRNGIRAKKEECEQKLEFLSKNQNKVNHWQNQNRKRQLPDDFTYQNSGEKRLKYQNENSPYMMQYDGAEDEDGKSTSGSTVQPIDNSMLNSGNRLLVNNVNMKPVIVNNQMGAAATSNPNMGSICVLNMTQGNAQNTRIMVNQNSQFKLVKVNNNQVLRFVTPTQNLQFQQGKPNITNTTIPMHKPGQFVLVNNVAGGGHTPISGVQMVYNPQKMMYNGMQVPMKIGIGNPQQQQQQQQQQQCKRILPMDSSMLQQQQRPITSSFSNQMANNSPMFTNVMVGQPQRMSTPVQGRRTISKVTHSSDSRMLSNNDLNDELNQRKEMDHLCNEVVSCDQQIESLEKQIAEIEYRIEQANIDIAAPFKLYSKSPMERLGNGDQEEDFSLPDRNPYKWPLESKEFTRSIFLYKKECLRALIISGGRIDVPGFEVEKKRLNNVCWSYPSSRPGLSATWRYQVSRVLNSEPLEADTLDLAATEPQAPDGEHRNSGCSGLSALALCLKVLWYSLRWDDMLANWHSGTSEPSRGIFRETLVNGDLLERKIINWRPLDRCSSRCLYLLTVCVTTTAAPSTASHSASVAVAIDTSRGRASRHGRQRTVARYTDADNFTDDGERDSDDSDPNFIPGQSRAGRPRGRRTRNHNNSRIMEEEARAPEKRFREEWAEEELLELWEIRDYLASVGWRRAATAFPNYKNTFVSTILHKRVFQAGPPMVTAPPNVARVVQPHNGLLDAIVSRQQPLPSSIPSSVPLPEEKKVVAVSTIQTSTETPIEAETITMATTTASATSQLIIESSSLRPRDQEGPVAVAAAPVPITDIREVRRGGKRGRGRPSLRRRSSGGEEAAQEGAETKSKAGDMLAALETGAGLLAGRLATVVRDEAEVAAIGCLERADEAREAIVRETAQRDAAARKTRRQAKDSIRDRRRDRDHGHSSEELTDQEVQTGSTSPAVDGTVEEEEEPVRAHVTVGKGAREDRRAKKRAMDEGRALSPKTKVRKIAEDSRDEGEVYCVCRTVYDPSRGYIGCDACQNWFHFECVGMSEKKASAMKLWKCAKCSPKDKVELPPASPIATPPAVPAVPKDEKVDTKDDVEIYCSCKSIYDPTRLYIACDFCDEWYHPQCVQMSDEEANNYQGSYKCPSCSGHQPTDSRTGNSSSSSMAVIDHEKKITAELRKKLSELLNKMMKHKDGAPFVKPVESKKCPRYYQVVRSPMDLSTAKTNLEKSKYPTIGAFKLDMHKIFTACRIYFDHSAKENHSADNLETYFLTELKSICNL